jgi:Wax ester synthase-like Acyl-CoA acyltransferase domain
MRSSIDRLTALDQLMLRASTAWPQDIGALALLDGTNLLDSDGRFRIEAVREAIASRLQLVPRFRQVVFVPRRGLGGPLWVDAPSFELSQHVRVLPLPAGSGEADLLVASEQLRSRRLDPSRPLWELWFLTGLPDGRIALFVKLHHAIADGMAAMTTISAFLDTAPDAPTAPARPWTPAPAPSARALLADNLRRHLQRLAGAFSTLARPRTTLQRLRAAWPATRELLAEAPTPETSLDRMVGPGRTLALIRTTLDQVKEIAYTTRTPDEPAGRHRTRRIAPGFSLTMEPPGTAVRTAVLAGHARPSGSKLSVLLRSGYAFTSWSCAGRRGTEPSCHQPSLCSPLVCQPPGPAVCQSSGQPGGRLRAWLSVGRAPGPPPGPVPARWPGSAGRPGRRRRRPRRCRAC